MAEDSFQAYRPGDLVDERLLVGRFDVLTREFSELRGVVERLVVTVTASTGETREIRREISMVVDLIGRMQERFEARCDAIDKRVDALVLASNRHEVAIEVHARHFAVLIPRPKKVVKRVKTRVR